MEQSTRSLYFAADADGKLAPAATMAHAVLEVLLVPEEYATTSALQIVESVTKSGVIETRARAGTRGGPVRITWDAVVEKGIAVGVLGQEDA